MGGKLNNPACLPACTRRVSCGVWFQCQSDVLLCYNTLGSAMFCDQTYHSLSKAKGLAFFHVMDNLSSEEVRSHGDV